MLYYCAEMALTKGEHKIHLVFARQPQVKIGRIASTIEEYGHLFPEIATFTEHLQGIAPRSKRRTFWP